MRDLFPVSGRIRDRGGCAHAGTNERKTLDAGCLHHRLDVFHPALEAQVVNVSVRETHAPVVMSPDAPSETGEPVGEPSDVRPSAAIQMRVSENVGGEDDGPANIEAKQAMFTPSVVVAY